MRWLKTINLRRSLSHEQVPAPQGPSLSRPHDDFVGLLFPDSDGHQRHEIEQGLRCGPVFVVKPGVETDRLLKALALCRAITVRG
jgi:hypothetical protein